ncbi:AAA family ATPase [Dapis sp. BLCC M229]|uniref:AAA family ATPase n=1 Tax=Dapis sp. BLCC M229 TaxID=3400188 RepID=UPI003CEB9985
MKQKAPISDVRQSRVVASAKHREDVKTRLIILIGLPASGKSTLARKIVSRYPRCQLISTDAIRAQLFGDEAIQGPWLQVWQEVQQQFHQAVSLKSLAIYDATNTQRRRRKELIELARETGFSYITGLWLDKSLELCLERNKQRQRQVPEEVIMKMSRQLTNVLPSCEEGFDRLQRITR